MNFFDSILEVFGVDKGDNSLCKCVLFGENNAYFEGIKKIESFLSEQIVLATKKCRITVFGENLVIKKFCLGDVFICGKITGIKKEDYTANT